MAEVNRPAGEPPAENGRHAADVPTTGEERAAVPEGAEPGTAVPARPAPEGAEPREPIAEPQEPTTARPGEAVAAGEREPEPGTTERMEPAPATRRLEPEAQPAPAARPAAETRPAPAPQQPLPPTEEAPAPQKRSNRLVGTAWVLLAAGLFEALFFAVNALVALVFGGPASVLPQLRAIAGTTPGSTSALAWLPVLLFFLLFELTVLIINRGTRVAYVLASLIVAIVVYVLTVLLFSLIVRHALGDVNTLAQTFLNWEFILVGIVAREVMLWTGLAIGSRGMRVRRRYRDERQRYQQERTDVAA